MNKNRSSRSQQFSIATIIMTVVGVTAISGCDVASFVALANEPLPSALEAVRSAEFEPTPKGTLTAEDLAGTDRLVLSDIVGCWGYRETGGSSDFGSGAIVSEVFDAFVFSETGFQQQTLIEFNGVRFALSTGSGLIEKAGDNTIAWTYSESLTFKSALGTPDLPDSQEFDGLSPRSNALISIDDDLLTLIFVLDDGTEETRVYRRFDCP